MVKTNTSNPTINLTTAAHCGSGGWYHHGVYMGSTNVNSNNLPNPYSDSQRFGVASGHITQPYNKIFYAPSDTWHTISSKLPGTSHYKGAILYSSGAASGARYGSVVYTSVLYFEGGHWISGTQVHFGSPLGDSGGPVFRGSTAWGITSQANSTDTLVSPEDQMELDLNVHICITSGC